MESAHEIPLFTSCDASKKKKKRTREFFYAFQLVNKSCSSSLHGAMFLFHTHLDLHHEIRGERL